LTKAEWKKISTYLVVAYEIPGREVPAPKLLVYFEQLQHEDAADVWHAVRACVRELKFLPTVAEIRERLPGQHARLTAAEAWQFVIEHMGNKDCEPVWPDALLAECVRGIGGWYRLNLEQQENLRYRRREFCELYEVKAARREYQQRVGTVTGARLALDRAAPSQGSAVAVAHSAASESTGQSERANGGKDGGR